MISPKSLGITAALFIFAGLSLFGQTSDWQRDSIYFDEGIPQTSEFENLRRVYFQEYDGNGRPILILTRRPDAMGIWKNWRRRHFNYENGDLVNLLIQYWDPVGEDWQDATERTFVYDGDGNILSKQVQLAPGPGMPLENQKRWDYFYNMNGNQDSILYRTWMTDDWQNVSRQGWTYNGQDLLEGQILQLWDDTEWVNARQRVWEYEGGTGFLSTVTEQQWSATANEWDNIARTEYSSNGSPFWSGVRYQVWDEVIEDWENEKQETFVYDGTWLENRVLQKWEDDEWKNQFRLEYRFFDATLNTYGNQWDTDQGTWATFGRFQINFDDDNRPLVEQGWQFWNEGLETWENDDLSFRRTHYWSQQSVATEEINQADHCRIPNPYILHTEFSCEFLSLAKSYELLLVNLVGQVVYRKMYSGADIFSIQGDIPTGLYVVNIRSGSELLFAQKLMIIQ